MVYLFGLFEQTKERGIWAKDASKLNADVWKSKAKVTENEFSFHRGMSTLEAEF